MAQQTKELIVALTSEKSLSSSLDMFNNLSKSDMISLIFEEFKQNNNSKNIKFFIDKTDSIMKR